MWHVTKGKGSETPAPPPTVTQDGHLNNLCLRGKMVHVCVWLSPSAVHLKLS